MTKVSIDSKVCDAHKGQTLFQLAENMGLKVPTSCNCQGKCKECLMEVTLGMEHLSPPARAEAHLLSGFRLSCLSRISGESGEIKAQLMGRGDMQIEERSLINDASGQPLPLKPAVRREGRCILIDEVAVGESDGPLLGLAIDLGTTTVALRVIDLESGKQIASAAFENPQRFGGSNVMARIQYDSEHPQKLLQQSLLSYLAHSLRELPIDSSRIFEIVLAGNPTMRDLFFGLDIYPLGQKPYQSITEKEWRAGKRTGTELTAEASALNLPVNPKARVYGLPLIGGHVGADTAACLLAVELHKSGEYTALMDLGTNTELVFANEGKLICASCPAGPAFEGGGIARGMAAVAGAISRVRYNEESCDWELETIANKPARGICGSGLIDLLSELLRSGQMNASGRFANAAERILLSSDNEVFLHQNDINELSQAKGANVAGIAIAAQHSGLALERLEHFYLAGGFGRHLNIAAARNIGLIPDLAESKIISAGNLAIEGASIALLNIDKRRELEVLVKSIKHIELENDPDFFDYFVQGCQFNPILDQLDPE